MADILRDENDYLEHQTEDWMKREAELKPNGEILIPISSFIKLPRAVRNRITRNLIIKAGKSLRRIGHSHIQSVYRLARGKKPQGILNLPNGLVVRKIYDKLKFTVDIKQKPNDFHYILDGPGTFYLKQIARSISLKEIEGNVDLNMENSPWAADLDADKLNYPLVARNFRPGDRFVPFGMVGHKKIKDFFIDLKIPSDMRASIPILISNNTPVWIGGYRIDERFKVTPNTKKILRITIA